MFYKRFLGLTVLILLLTIPAMASMVSFLVVETGLNEDAPQNQVSSIWGGGLMAAFFDAGHIVTDIPIMRMENRPSRDLSGKVEEDFNEALTVGSEYFILGFLEYELQSGRPVPISISVKVYKIDNKKLIHEQSFPVGKGSSPAEEHKNAQNAGKAIISYIAEK